MYRMVWPANEWRTVREHLVAAGNREAGLFLLVRWGASAAGGRLLVHRVLHPPEGGLEREGRDFLRPSGQWLSAVMGTAIDERTGLAFIHSHPNAYHPPDLSPIDWETTMTWSRSITPTLGGPFASLVWSPQGLAGVMFLRDDPGATIRLRKFESLGEGGVEQLHLARRDVDSERSMDDRQVRALTALGNRRLRDLNVAVIGAGGTGSPVAEQLVRMGVAAVTLVDPDVIDESSNLRRVVGSRRSDLTTTAKKVDVVARHLESLGLGTKVPVLARDIREEPVVRQLLDCDIIINTTDTQSSRAMLNQIAYQYWVPIVDVGVRVGTKADGAVSGMPVEVRVLLPDNGCLWCRKGVLDSQAIYEENLPADERARLAAEGYIQGVGQPQASLTPLNYFAAALALLTMTHLYSGQPVHDASIVFDAWEQFVHPLDSAIDPSCICSQWRGQADDLPVAFLPARVTT
jgi:molybdopterin/thiamine biosynthesis adenylyltransferase